MLGGAGLFQLLEWVAVYRAQSQVRENHSPQLLTVWGPKGWLESITILCDTQPAFPLQ